MGKLSRFACIFVPYLLTIGAVVCLALYCVGQVYTNDTSQHIYFFMVSKSSLTSLDDDESLN